MNVDPFHNTDPWASDHKVYHNSGDCHDGQNIKQEHKEDGTGGRDLCKVCEKLNLRTPIQIALDRLLNNPPDHWPKDV